MGTNLKTDFFVGFELEAFAYISDFIDLDNYDFEENVCCNYLNDYNYEPDEGEYNPLEEFYNNIRNFFKREFGLSGNVHYDGSVKGFKDGYNGFEWSSNPMRVTPHNMNCIKTMLKKLKYDNIHINDTCGFHTHFSNKNITEQDAMWILMVISMNDNFVKEITEFEYLDKNDYELFGSVKHVKFSNDRYADKNFLTLLKNAINEKKYLMLAHLLNDEKYRVLRIHPQGTLEWRGPRGFIESDNGVDSYIKKVYNIIDIFQYAIECKTLNGISKKEWMDNIYVNYVSDGNRCDLPLILSERQIKNNKFGIVSFGNNNYDTFYSGYNCHRHRYNDPCNLVSNKIIDCPRILVEDSSLHTKLNRICNNLNIKNKLRYVIESINACGITIPLNVQWFMILNNPTLLPYVTRDLWKHLSVERLIQIIRDNGFRIETDNKKKMIDYIIEQLHKYIDISSVLYILTSLCEINGNWVYDYIYSKKDIIFEKLNLYYNEVTEIYGNKIKIDSSKDFICFLLYVQQNEDLLQPVFVQK